MADDLKRASRSGLGGVKVSFEFFPPKTAEMDAQLWEAITRLAPLRPKFISITYGAGGSTRERTHATVARIVKETMIRPAAHLTCVAASRAEVDAVIRGYWNAGVRHIVALRGDPAGGLGSTFEPHPEGYATSTDLVAGIRRVAAVGGARHDGLRAGRGRREKGSREGSEMVSVGAGRRGGGGCAPPNSRHEFFPTASHSPLSPPPPLFPSLPPPTCSSTG